MFRLATSFLTYLGLAALCDIMCEARRVVFNGSKVAEFPPMIDLSSFNSSSLLALSMNDHDAGNALSSSTTALPEWVIALIIAGLLKAAHHQAMIEQKRCYMLLDSILNGDPSSRGMKMIKKGSSWWQGKIYALKRTPNRMTEFFESHVFGVQAANDEKIDCDEYIANLEYTNQMEWFKGHGASCTKKGFEGLKLSTLTLDFANFMKNAATAFITHQFDTKLSWSGVMDYCFLGLPYECCASDQLPCWHAIPLETASASCRYAIQTVVLCECTASFDTYMSGPEPEIRLEQNFQALYEQFQPIVNARAIACETDNDCPSGGTGMSCAPAREWKSRSAQFGAGMVFGALYGSGLWLKNYLVAWAAAHKGAAFSGIASGLGKFVAFNDIFPIIFKALKFDRVFHKDGQMRCRITQCQYNSEQERCEAQVVNVENKTFEEYGVFEPTKLLDGTQCVPVVEEAGMIWGTLGWTDKTVCKNQMCPQQMEAGQASTTASLSNCGHQFLERVRVGDDDRYIQGTKVAIEAARHDPLVLLGLGMAVGPSREEAKTLMVK